MSGVPSAASNLPAVNEVAVVTAELNRPTSHFTGVFVAVTPSKVAHHSLIQMRVVDAVFSSRTLLAVPPVRAMASTLIT